jgi:hypothetical protein
LSEALAHLAYSGVCIRSGYRLGSKERLGPRILLAAKSLTS